jgi:hypothetical protein
LAFAPQSSKLRSSGLAREVCELHVGNSLDCCSGAGSVHGVSSLGLYVVRQANRAPGILPPRTDRAPALDGRSCVYADLIALCQFLRACQPRRDWAIRDQCSPCKQILNASLRSSHGLTMITSVKIDAKIGSAVEGLKSLSATHWRRAIGRRRAAHG